MTDTIVVAPTMSFTIYGGIVSHIYAWSQITMPDGEQGTFHVHLSIT